MALDVRIMCLGVLSEGDASGYELQKAFKEGPYGHFLEASYGSIYPALTRLTEEGLATFAAHAQEGRPDKKVYSITEAGRTALTEAVSQDPLEDKFRSEFLFMISFADLMDKTQVAKLIDGRLEALRANEAILDEAENEVLTLGQKFVHGYGRAMMETSLKYLTENRDLVETSAASTDTPLEHDVNPRASVVGD